MGKLFVISAPSGTGKTSLIQAILESPNSTNTRLGISCTTRKQRPKEENGISYFFISEDRFKEKIKSGDFLEYAKVFGNYYGTPKDWVLATLTKNNVLLELDTQGALQVKKSFPDAKTIFLIPPSYEDLLKRLSARAQDDDEEISKRLKEAKKEINTGKDFDFVILNDNFDDSLKDLEEFMLSNNKLSEKRAKITKITLDQLLD
tara:strand:+ start:215 stop:826 length:612 start_codon:yes stop_codon:yes gene_type:complete